MSLDLQLRSQNLEEILEQTDFPDLRIAFINHKKEQQ